MNGVRFTVDVGRAQGGELFDFEKLTVYQLALELLDRIFEVCRSLPSDSRYAIGNQLIRAGLSISNNLAEGSGKRSKKEKVRYYGTSLDSSRECISMFNVLNRQQLVPPDVYVELRQRTRRITGMLHGLINSAQPRS